LTDNPWSDSNEATVAVKKLQAILGLDEAGNVTLGYGADTDNALELLCDLYRFSSGMPFNIRHDHVRRAVMEARKANELSLAAVAHRIAAKNVAYLRQPLKPFVLLMRLSVHSNVRIPAVRLGGGYFSFARLAPSRFRTPSRVQRGGLHYGDPPAGYWASWVRVQSRDPVSAGWRAIDLMDLLRAIWNFTLNVGRWRFTSSGHVPFNEILQGPVHTLHQASGRPFEDHVWWDPNYRQPRSTLAIDQHLPRLQRFLASVRKALRRSAHREVLRSALLQYVRALDEYDANTSFLRLWSLLETLTGTTGGTHETTVKRLVFLSPDPEFHRLSFNRLRRWRNRIVHEGEAAQGAEQMVNEVKQYAEKLFMTLLRHGKQFADIYDFGAFLNSPTTVGALRRKQSQYRLALRMRK